MQFNERAALGHGHGHGHGIPDRRGSDWNSVLVVVQLEYIFKIDTELKL